MTADHLKVDIIFCASSNPSLRVQLETDLLNLAEGAFSVRTVATASKLLQESREVIASGAFVPLVLVDEHLDTTGGIASLIALNDLPGLRSARKVLVAENHCQEDLDRGLANRALDGTLAIPWSPAQLKAVVSRLLTEYFIEEAPQEVDEVTEVVDVDVLSKAFVAVEERAQEADRRLSRLQRSFLDDRSLSDDEVGTLMIEEIDRALNNPPRTTVPPGTLILNVGDPVDGIRVVEAGRVQLTRDVGDHTLIFHARTAGRVIGLNAIALSETTALFTVTAIEETTFIALTLEELDDALRHSPTLAIHFVTVLLRSMARRNQRSIELRMTVDSLVGDLKKERDDLAQAIDRLNRTRARLVESEKLATLGQLAAGVGHELNNPAAVISRSTDFLSEDIEALASEILGGDQLVDTLHGGKERRPVSTREQRRLRNQLADSLGDVRLARRLVQIGIDSEEAYKKIFGDDPDPSKRLDRLEHFHRIGASLRSMDVAARRIVKLVGSLKSYARGSQERVEGLDVCRGLEETLLLLGHDLSQVRVETSYADSIPLISGYPGDLNQVWTNLITNAIQAMDPTNARLSIDVRASASNEVQVSVTDNGHGIPPENLERIFEPAFTTKAGRVEFGLGLGLQIVKDIVVRHGGTIGVESKPGRTCFTVQLPTTETHGGPT